MPKEEQAPLVEVIFEVRWGKASKPQPDTVQFHFDEEDITLFAGLFRSAASAEFPCYKKVNEAIPLNMPHTVKHQFWTGENQWPCLQVGLGIMTANLTDQNYSWDLFRTTCAKALKLLDAAHHQNLQGLPAIGVELRYQDGFVLKGNESENDFVKNKAQITFDVPSDFLESDLFEPRLNNHHIVFSVPVTKPKGVLVNSLNRGLIGGKVGFIQTTVLRSTDALCPEFTQESLEKWLEDAHATQQHVYKTLIQPTFERSL